MRLPRLLCLLAGLLCSGSAWSARTAFQARCEDTLGPARVALSAHGMGYRIDNSFSYKALAGLKDASPPAGSYVLGLTKTESRIALAVDGGMLTDPQSGQECIAPKIAVELSYIPVVIYVGREFRPETCAYQEILAHEMRHLKAYLDQLPKVEAVVGAALKQRFQAKPIYAPAGQAKALLDHEMNAQWLPYIKNEMMKVERLQGAIDSPQEYARLSKVCKGEVQLLIGPPKRNKR
jgi:hypothetical protein